jgi:outer membrane protein OmpA-like peptidoglycan-associated protein
LFLSLTVRRFLAVTASLGVVAGLSGCGGGAKGSESTGAIAFVVGARSNMPAPRLDGQAMEALERAVAVQSQASVVVADGKPSVVGAVALAIEGANGTARERSVQENRDALGNALRNARADDPESDLLTALDLAGREVRSVTTDPGTLVVVDSGLSTVAPLDFSQPGLLDADPQEVADSLRAGGELPNLSGVRVVLQGLGDTAAPQEPLSIPQRTNLIAIWEAVLSAAGAPEVEVVEKQLRDEPVEGLPGVTPVPLTPGVECRSSTVVLTGGDVAFKADSAVFRDEAAAAGVLAPIAEQLLSSGATATLTGTTADVGDLAGQRELSLERADAVRDVLVRLGVPEANLTVEGLGSDFPGYVQDHDSGGNLIPGAAAANRKVIVSALGGALSCN